MPETGLMGKVTWSNSCVCLRHGGHKGGVLAAVPSILWSKILSECECQEETQTAALRSGWLSCMKIPWKMVCNARLLPSMLLGRSLLEKFSVWTNVNCPCSSTLTVLTKSKKSLYFCLYFGRVWENKVLCLSPLDPWGHPVMTSTK